MKKFFQLLIPCLLSVATSLAANREEVTALVDSAYNLAMSGDIAKAIQINEDGLALTPPDSASWQCEFYSCLLYCYHRLGDYERALEYGEKCLLYDEKQGDQVNLSASLGNLAGIYSSAGQHDIAENYLRRAIQIEKQLLNKDPEHSAKSLAIRKAMLGEVLLAKSKTKGEVEQIALLSEALQLTDEALLIDRKLQRRLQEGMRLAQMGNIYEAIGQENNARKYTLEALIIAQETNNIMTEIICLLQLQRFQEAADIAHEKGFKKQEYEAYDQLYMQAKGKGEWRAALAFLEKARLLYEQLQSDETQRQLTLAQVRYQSLKKEQQIEEQKHAMKLQNEEKERALHNQKMRTRLFFIASIVAFVIVALLVIVIVLLRYRKKAIENTAAYKERQYTILSHDLTNPMVAQQQVLRILYRDHSAFTQEKMQKLIGQLLAGSDNQLALLRNLSEVARLDRNRGMMQITRMDLAGLVQDSLATVESIAKMKDVKIEVRTERTMVMADRNAIRTVLTNLINNAVKFTPKGGTVSISTKASGELYVKDNGIGMSPQRIEQLLHADKPVQSTIGTDGENGTGLGIMLCRELIRLNKGKFTILSREGEGTTCMVTLPLPKEK